jgi:tetratricopeptide (TPR) repeat protein
LRETAYEFTPKTHRQRRHDFVARWYAAQGDALAVAYHVEAAWRLRTELRPGDPELPELASEVVDTLTEEGMRALNRKDLPSAVQLLERARALLAPGDARHTALALHVCDAALWLWDVDRCLAALAAAEAALPGDRHNQAVCAIQREIVSLRLGLVSPEHVATNVATLTAALDRDPGDDLSWCRFHYLTACQHLVEERTAAAEAALRLALARARAMADGYEEDWLLCAICELAQWAPTPVDVGLALCRTLAVRFATNRAPLLPVLVTWANLLVLAGDFAGAEGKLATLAEHLDEIHLDLPAAAALEITGQLAALSGRHDQAEDSYRRALDLLRTREQTPDTENIEVLIARAIFAQGRPAEAARCLERIEAGVVRSPRARIAATALRGRIASAGGEHESAVATATTARELSDGSDDLRLAGETEFDLAVVLHAAGRERDAAAAAAAALRAFEAKGASVLADQVRAWLSVEAVGDPEVPGG